MRNNEKTCLVGGNYCLDIIIKRSYPDGFVLGRRNRYIDTEVLRRVGQTAGNVSCILPYLGVRSFPIAHFDTTPEGRQIAEDLVRYGADTRFVQHSPQGGTTLMACTRKRDQRTGEPVIAYHGWSPGSPRFQRHKAPRGRDEAPAFLSALDFTPSVFFFDSHESGWRVIAQGLREKGTLVYYEPESAKSLNKDAVAKSDIIKFSGAKIGDCSFCDAYSDKLFIKTLGADGLVFKLNGGVWQNVDPVSNDNVVDCEGAGDWTSAQLIASLCSRDLLSVDTFTEENVRECLEEAVAAASRSLSYLSAKGLIDSSS